MFDIRKDSSWLYMRSVGRPEMRSFLKRQQSRSGLAEHLIDSLCANKSTAQKACRFALSPFGAEALCRRVRKKRKGVDTPHYCLPKCLCLSLHVRCQGFPRCYIDHVSMGRSMMVTWVSRAAKRMGSRKVPSVKAE